MIQTNMLDDSLLLQYMETFYGYGNLDGKYWFIGMEDGSDGTIAEIVHRLNHWKERGKVTTDDLVAQHTQFGIQHLIGPKAKLQPTWKKLIRIILSAEGHDVDIEMVKEFQRTKLGIHTGNNCILEILPLPSKSTGTWIYHKYSKIPELESRKRYKQTWFKRRTDAIQRLIQTHRPRCIIFYSINPEYQFWWKQIAGSITPWKSIDKVQITHNNDTIFAITSHPVTHGITNEYFHNVGRLLAQEQSRL